MEWLAVCLGEAQEQNRKCSEGQNLGLLQMRQGRLQIAFLFSVCPLSSLSKYPRL